MAKRILTAESVDKHVDVALGKMRKMFTEFIESGDSHLMKNSDTLAFWLETFSDYLQWEKDFDYSSLPRYKRGNVISVNLGFNVGSEQGGLHYAVVINKYTERTSPVLTVIPLTSGTQEDTYKRDVYLGNELYDALTKRYNETVTRLQSMANTDQSANEQLRLLQAREKKVIDSLKTGSIALMSQITTVSKIRIYKPKSKNDLMYNLRLSDSAMDKIDSKLRELFHL